MEDVLEVYQRHYEEDEVLICMDENSKQHIKETRIPLPTRPGEPERFDYEYEGRVRWINRAEAGLLLQKAAIDPRALHLPEFILLALHTGCRRGELLALEWRRVDPQAGLIYLEAEHTTTGRRRSVPLNRVARAAIINRMRFRAQYCPASPWVFCIKQGKRIADVKRSFAKACERAGITDFRIHDLRHTCAAWLVTAGVPLAEVRDLLGHRTIAMTERYAHLSPENVRVAVSRIETAVSQSGHTEEEEQTENAG